MLVRYTNENTVTSVDLVGGVACSLRGRGLLTRKVVDVPVLLALFGGGTDRLGGLGTHLIQNLEIVSVTHGIETWVH